MEDQETTNKATPEPPTPSQPQPPAPPAAAKVTMEAETQYMPLRVFADTHAEKYGIELMAGFFHVQEVAKHFADTEENWHKLMEQFQGKEVK